MLHCSSQTTFIKKYKERLEGTSCVSQQKVDHAPCKKDERTNFLRLLL